MRVDDVESYEAWKEITASLSSDQAFLVDSVEAIAGFAEELLDKNNLPPVEALRQGYTEYQNDVGVLHPNIMARILAVFAIWWAHSESFITECTPFETSVVMFGVLEYQKELQDGSGEDQSHSGASHSGVSEDGRTEGEASSGEAVGGV